MTHLPFDEVLLRLPAGERKLTPAEFLALPLSERIGYVLSRTVSFFLRGREVDRHTALAELRQARAAS